MRAGPLLLATALVAGACGGGEEAAPPTAFDAVVEAATPGFWRASGSEVIEVWVCHVPVPTSNPLYGGLPLRLPILPATLAPLFQQAGTYFDRLSDRGYTPRFVAGGEVQLDADGGPTECVDAAIAGAADDTRVVLAVADAEHLPDQRGGQGSGGDPEAGTSVADTRRYAYVGGSDFNRATWGGLPPMDLVEHELGHTLGWVHSGVDGAGDYTSALDVMSNSAAPRDVDPDRRDAPDTIGIQRVIAGWLPAADVVQAIDAATVVLEPSNTTSGTRLLVLPVDAVTFLTVELLTADGYDDHLPADGFAVHEVAVDADGTVTSIQPVHGTAPFVELLQPGDTFTASGWKVTFAAAGEVTAIPSG